MGKLGQKYLLGFLLALAAAQFVFAAATKFTNVEVTGSLTVDGATVAQNIAATSVNCSNVSTTTLTANTLVATTSVAASSATLSSTTAPLKFTGVVDPTGIPVAVGLLGMNSAHVLYASTSTTAGGWQKVSAQ